MAIHQSIFSILAFVTLVYSVLCTIRIILTWIPGLENSFTLFLKRICDPYLNFFSKRGILRLGILDFSPLLALAILAVFSTIFSSLSISASISFATVLSLIVEMSWNVISSITGFILILLIIRLIALLISGNSYSGNQFVKMLDNLLNPLIYKIANTFSNHKMLPYRTALIISIAAFIVVQIAGYYFFYELAHLIRQIPF